MDRLSDFDTLEGLAVRQTRKGCCQSLIGCESNNEFKITPMDNDKAIMIAEESSSFCIRLCCGPIRPFTVKLRKDDDVIAEFDRPWRNMPHPMKVIIIHSLICPILAHLFFHTLLLCDANSVVAINR